MMKQAIDEKKTLMQDPVYVKKQEELNKKQMETSMLVKKAKTLKKIEIVDEL